MAIRTQVDKARRVLEGLGSLGITKAVEEEQEGGKKKKIGEGEGESGEAERDDEEALRMEREAEVWAATDAACA